MRRNEKQDTPRQARAATLLNVRGRDLLYVREEAGYSRARLSQRMRRDDDHDAIPSSPNTLLRYESTIGEVKPLVAAAYRRAIGEELFDALLERLRLREEEYRKEHERLYAQSQRSRQ
ncbi:MAG: hypothetical protein JST22_06860 [Bacteroidetes bacterium]|nr:hypothetical protein [Bacteroidota bacterium]